MGGTEWGPEECDRQAVAALRRMADMISSGEWTVDRARVDDNMTTKTLTVVISPGKK